MSKIIFLTIYIYTIFPNRGPWWLDVDVFVLKSWPLTTMAGCLNFWLQTTMSDKQSLGVPEKTCIGHRCSQVIVPLSIHQSGFQRSNMTAGFNHEKAIGQMGAWFAKIRWDVSQNQESQYWSNHFLGLFGLFLGHPLIKGWTCKSHWTTDLESSIDENDNFIAAEDRWVGPVSRGFAKITSEGFDPSIVNQL